MMFLWYNLGMTTESNNAPIHPSDPNSLGRGPGMFDMQRNINFAANTDDRDAQEAAEVRNSQNRQNLEQYAMGHGSTELLRMTSSPEAAGFMFSRLLDRFENPASKEAFDRYSLKPWFQILDEKIRDFEITRTELDMLGISGTATIEGKVYEVAKIPGFSLKSELIEFRTEKEMLVTETPMIAKGKPLGADERAAQKTVKIRKIEELSTREVVSFGTDEIRQKKADGFREIEYEAIVREKAGTLYWAGYMPTTAALDASVENFYMRLPKFSNAELKKWYSLPDHKLAMLGSPENTIAGDEGVDTAMALFYLISQSEFKGKMDEALSCPKFTDEVFEGMTQEQIKVWTGDTTTWVEDNIRHMDSYKEGEVRGLLSQFGDIYARGGKNKEKILQTAVKQFVAERYHRKYPQTTKKDAERFADNAVRQAYMSFKMTALAAEVGYETFKKIKIDGHVEDSPEFPTDKSVVDSLLKPESDELRKKLNKTYLLEGDPMTDDWTKIIHLRAYRVKEFLKGRSAGPGTTIANTSESTSLSLWTLARCQTDNGLRSFKEQWLGSPERKITTSDGTVVTFPKEPSTKLGKLPWELDLKLGQIADLINDEDIKEIEDELEADTNGEISPDAFSEADIWSWYSLGLFLPGRKENQPLKGMYNIFYQEFVSDKDLTNAEMYKHKNKFFPICVNNGVKARGEYLKITMNLAKSLNRMPTQAEVDDHVSKITNEETEKNKKLWLQGVIDSAPLDEWKLIAPKYQKSIMGGGGTKTDDRPILQKIYNIAKSYGFPIPDNFPEYAMRDY